MYRLPIFLFVCFVFLVLFKFPIFVFVIFFRGRATRISGSTCSSQFSFGYQVKAFRVVFADVQNKIEHVVESSLKEKLLRTSRISHIVVLLNSSI